MPPVPKGLTKKQRLAYKRARAFGINAKRAGALVKKGPISPVKP